MTDPADGPTIRPLTPDRLLDLASLFNEGGDPKRCWCTFFRVRNADIIDPSPEANRQVLEHAVEVTAAEHRSPGLVAYDEDGRPIGWVSLGPRDDYQRLQHSKVLYPLDDRPVWSIVCFVVGRRARGTGIASAMLDAAIAYAREQGATLLESYPVDTSGGRVPSANVYKGTVRMFERAGFEIVARRRANRSSAERPIMRRAL